MKKYAIMIEKYGAEPAINWKLRQPATVRELYKWVW